MTNPVLRDLRHVQSVIQEEFQGQVEFSPLDDDLTQLTFDISPKSGPYKHARLKFCIHIPSEYPFEAPTVTCFSPPFHPNIDPTNTSNNVCVNILLYWESSFRLSSVLHALLFLCYEPNFESPLNPHMPAFNSEVTFEDCVNASLFGGTLNGCTYLPNHAWCTWAKQNGVNPPRLPASLYTPMNNEQPQDVNHLGISSPTTPPNALDRQLSDVGGYFRRELSAVADPYGELYAPIDDITRRPYLPAPSVISAFRQLAFIVRYRVTVERFENSNDSSTQPWANVVKYYFAEHMCQDNINFQNILDGSSFVNVFSNPAEICLKVQRSSYEFWHPVQVPDELFRRALYEPYFPWSEYEPGVDSVRVSISTDVTNKDIPENVSLSDMSYSPVGDSVDQDQGKTTNSGGDGIPDSAVSYHNLDPNKGSSNTGTAEIDVREATVVPLADESATSELVENPPVDISQEAANSMVDEIDVGIDDVPDADGVDQERMSQVYDFSMTFHADYRTLCAFLREQAPVLLYLKPRFWPLYQTRWPPFLAPGNAITVGPDTIKLASPIGPHSYSFQLLHDLYRVYQGPGCANSLVLIDPLALSPFTPIFNFLIRVPLPELVMQKNPTTVCILRSVAWASCTNFLTSAMLPRQNLFNRSLSSLMSSTFLFSNWIAYASRMELYGLTFGYSRIRFNWVIFPVASTCLCPATLGCGQTPLLDAWPLWLLARIGRVVGRLLFSFCGTRILPSSHFPFPRLFIPFHDLDYF